MTLERFKKLTEIYGANLQSWPKQHRNEINQLSETNFAQLREILDKEAKLDALLDSHRIMPPDRAFFDQLVASAPQATRKHERSWYWLTGASIAGIGLASALAGAFCISLCISALMTQPSEVAGTTSELIDFEHEWTAS